MAGNIKGIVVEIGADTSKLGKALKDATSESVNLTNELKSVEKGLKFDPGNVELIAQKQQILAQNVEATTKRLETLKNVQSQVDAQFAKGDITAEQYRAFQREITNTESALNGLKSKLSDVGGDVGKVDKLKSAFKDVASAAATAGKEIGIAMGATGAAGAAAVGGLVSGMQETNEQLGMLKVQASEVGLSLEDVGEARNAFTSVGQDINQTTEAMGHLIQAGYTTSDSINEISTSLAGAVVKYGEGFNVEGLAESITATTQLGESTGQFMDLLEKEGINVDDFNAKMAGMSTEQERANYISQLLADQGLTAMHDKYVEMNPETVKNAEAQLKLQESLAELATVFAPIVTKVTEIVSAFASWAAENPKLSSALAVVGGVIATVVGVFAALAPIVSVLVNLWPMLAAAFGAITAPVTAVIAIIAALIAIAVLLYKNWDEVKEYAKNAWEAIKEAVSKAVKATGEFISNTWNSIKTTLTNLWNGIKTTASTVWNGIKSYFTTVLNGYKTLFTNIWNGIKSVVMAVWNSLKSGATSIFNAIKNTISTIFNAVRNTISTIWNGIKSVFTSVLNTIKSVVTNGFNSMKSAISTAMNNVKTTISNIWNNVMSFFRGIDLKSIGGNIIKGLISGIKGQATAVVKAVSGTVNGAINAAKKLLKINSPSRVFMEIGEFTNEGFIKGIEDTSSKLNNTMDNVYGSLGSSAESMVNTGSGSVSNTTQVTNSTPINVVLNYSGNASTEDAMRMVDIIDTELGNRQRNRLRMSGVMG